MRKRAVFLLGSALCRADPKVDCFPILLDDTDAPYMGRDFWGVEADVRWGMVKAGCEKITNCDWNEGGPNPYCTYKDGHRWQVTKDRTIDKMRYQTIHRNNDNVSDQFPDYRGTNFSDYPALYDDVRVIVFNEASYRMRLKITDLQETRYEVQAPWNQLGHPVEYEGSGGGHFEVELAPVDSNFMIKISRSTGSVIFEMDYPGFVYEDQLIQMTARFPSDYVYGFGEHEHTTFKHDFSEFSRFTMFTRSHGVTPGPNLYGHHPFFMGLDKTGETFQAYGMFWLNSNAQEVDKIPADSGTTQPYMTFRAIGGIFDFFFFYGPTPNLVVQQYVEAIGRPYLVPYWSLGFHLSQWHYGHLDVVKNLFDRMTAAEIPFDVQQHDIDYMDQQKDFTVDPINYVGLKEWDEEKQADGLHIVIMLDPTLSFGGLAEYEHRDGWFAQTYLSTDTGMELDVWVMIEDPESTEANPKPPVPLVGKMWPDLPQILPDGVEGSEGGEAWMDWAIPTIREKVDDEDYSGMKHLLEDVIEWYDDENDTEFPKDPVSLCHYKLVDDLWSFQVHMCRAPLGFPDFWKPAAHLWWKDHLKEFHDHVPYDAIWIDMNEPDNEMHGSMNYFDKDAADEFYWVGGDCPQTRWDRPPYVPREWGYIDWKGLHVKSICPSATHRVHGHDERHYDVHSLYGVQFSLPTWEAVREITGKRSFVFSRTTYPGVGKYIGHWLGDNVSRWSAMKYSIIGNLEFNFFGIPFVGADICGFFADVYDDLCMRWTQLGAFYGFWRNHNAKLSRWQDPANFTVEFSQAAKRVHETRYSILPHVYTLFYHSAVEGTMVARSLMSEFFDTDQSLAALTADEEFMFGPALLVAPALDATDVDPDLPEDASDDEKEASRKAIPDVDAYLPAGYKWYDFYTGKSFPGGSTVNLHIPLYSASAAPGDDRYVMRDIGLFQRGGTVIPMQASAMRTHYQRSKPLDFLVALQDGKATGDLFWDDGESQDTVPRGEYQYTEYELHTESQDIYMRMHQKSHGEAAAPLRYGTLTIYGATEKRPRAHIFSARPQQTAEEAVASGVIRFSDLEVSHTDLGGDEFVTTIVFPEGSVSVQEELVLLYTDRSGGFAPSGAKETGLLVGVVVLLVGAAF